LVEELLGSSQLRTRGGFYNVKKVCGFSLLIVGLAGSLFATPVPEIDPASGANAVALLAGALLVIRSRRTR
jgi:hypothetical protein